MDTIRCDSLTGLLQAWHVGLSSALPRRIAVCNACKAFAALMALFSFCSLLTVSAFCVAAFLRRAAFGRLVTNYSTAELDFIIGALLIFCIILIFTFV